MKRGDTVSQKSYDGSPILYLIPTPIGNLEDMTYRAVSILKEVEVVFSEDTRVTANLFQHFDIHKKLIASHEHNEEKNITKCLEYLQSGYSVGVVSDRGTPVISDPGYALASAAIANGYHVVGLPGATALIPALIQSGLNPKPFTFYGFLNQKSGKRKTELEQLKDYPYTTIFYEAPHRIVKMLEDMLEIFGNRQISISREISKRFEEVYRGTITEVIDMVQDIKGELVVVVDGNHNVKSYDHLTIIEHVNLYIKEGKDSKEAMKLVAKQRHLSKSEVYSAYHGLEK